MSIKSTNQKFKDKLQNLKKVLSKKKFDNKNGKKS